MAGGLVEQAREEPERTIVSDGTTTYSSAAFNERVNRLIDEHNARYPIERSLPFDPEAGDYTAIGGRPYRRALLDAGWVFERFPPVLTAR